MDSPIKADESSIAASSLAKIDMVKSIKLNDDKI